MNNYSNRQNNMYYLEKENPFLSDLFGLLSEDNERLLKADIIEAENDYIIEVEVPGIKKENIKISLDNKYLTIETSNIKEESETKEKILHQERFYGKSSRSFYVGNVKKESIKASFDNGILSVSFPKKTPEEEQVNKYIEIA